MGKQLDNLYKRRFLDAILKNRDKFEIGDFIIFRNSKTGFANVLTKDAYNQGNGTYKSIKNKAKEDKELFKLSQPVPITDEELSFIE